MEKHICKVAEKEKIPFWNKCNVCGKIQIVLPNLDKFFGLNNPMRKVLA